MLINANVYKRPALRIILDRLELNDNPAPVDLSNLSIEHLMPQTPTEEWLEELDTDEESYMANLHRFGNLTLAAKADNSKMSNLQWDFKNAVLKSTAHLKLNLELTPIKKWTIDHINTRTDEMIKRTCKAFPYPAVSIVPKSMENIVDEISARSKTVQQLLPDCVEVKKNNLYKTVDNKTGYVLLASKMYPEGGNEKYWFGYREKPFESITECADQHFVLICRDKAVVILDIPRSYIDQMKNYFNYSVDDDGVIKHYHIVIHRTPDGKTTLLLSRPTLKRVDVSQFIVM